MLDPRSLRNGLLTALALLLTAGANFAQAGAVREGRQYALLIGVGRYEHRLRPLKYADHDVEELAEVLTAHGYERQNVWVMTYREAAGSPSRYPDRAHIATALRQLLRNLSPTDSVLVAFAGHGVQFKGDPECYLCPVDADLGRKETLLSVSEIYDLLQACGAGVKVLLADACRSDPRADTSRAVEEVKLSSTRFQPEEPPGGVAVLYSCSQGQEAFEDDTLRHGIFFHFVIEGLKGKAADPDDGGVTLAGLYQYLARRVDDFARRNQGRSQVPSLLRGQLSGTVTLLAGTPARAEGRAVAAAGAPAESARELRRLTGHGRMVTGTAFFPDGRHALSGSFDGTLRVWDLDTGAELRRLRADDMGWVRSVAVSADGRYGLSGGEDRVVRLWDLTGGTELRQLRGHKDAVSGVAFSPDGRYALSGSEDGTVCLWDLAAGTVRTCFRGHTGAVESVAFAQDGGSVVSGGADGTVRVWDVAAGAERAVFNGHEGSVLSVALSGDGRFALSGGSDHTLRVWDVQTVAQVRCFRGDMQEVLAVAFAPDGRRALCGGADRSVRLWDVDTGRTLAVCRGHETSVQAVAFAPDGRRVLSGSGGFDAEAEKDNSLRLWAVPN
jgi:uncharacterized caspase-like protein